MFPLKSIEFFLKVLGMCYKDVTNLRPPPPVATPLETAAASAVTSADLEAEVTTEDVERFLNAVEQQQEQPTPGGSNGKIFTKK